MLKKAILIVIGLIIIVGIRFMNVISKKPGRSQLHHTNEKKIQGIDQSKDLQATALPSADELFAQRNRLLQNIAGIVGGKMGLLMLLDAIQNSKDDELYRQIFRRKQTELVKYMKEYHELLDRSLSLPTEERDRINMPTEYYEQYQMLLNQKV